LQVIAPLSPEYFRFDECEGGALLPLLYFLQTVQKGSQISAILRLMPMMVAAAAFAPVAGGLTAKIGPRKVIAAGLVLMAAGSSLLILLTPDPANEYLQSLSLLEDNLMRTLTKDYSNCEFANLGYTNK
jgi:MFS family permease